MRHRGQAAQQVAHLVLALVVHIHRQVTVGDLVCQMHCPFQWTGDGAHQQCREVQPHQHQHQTADGGHAVGFHALALARGLGFLTHLLLQGDQCLLLLDVLDRRSAQLLFCNLGGGQHVALVARFLRLGNVRQGLRARLAHFLQLGFFGRAVGHLQHQPLGFGDLGRTASGQLFHLVHDLRFGGHHAHHVALHRHLGHGAPAHGQHDALVRPLHLFGHVGIDTVRIHHQPESQQHHGRHGSQHHRPQLVGHANILQIHGYRPGAVPIEKSGHGNPLSFSLPHPTSGTGALPIDKNYCFVLIHCSAAFPPIRPEKSRP